MTSRLEFADRLTLAALLLAAVAAAAGLLVSGLYRDTAEGSGRLALPTFVTLLVAVPPWHSACGAPRRGLGRRAHGGNRRPGLSCLLLRHLRVSVVINPLTPVHIAILGFDNLVVRAECLRPG